MHRGTRRQRSFLPPNTNNRAAKGHVITDMKLMELSFGYSARPATSIVQLPRSRTGISGVYSTWMIHGGSVIGRPRSWTGRIDLAVEDGVTSVHTPETPVDLVWLLPLLAPKTRRSCTSNFNDPATGTRGLGVELVASLGKSARAGGTVTAVHWGDQRSSWA